MLAPRPRERIHVATPQAEIAQGHDTICGNCFLMQREVIRFYHILPCVVNVGIPSSNVNLRTIL